jgi:hypothetical protein
VKGRELRREAGRLLWSWRGLDGVHYREWFERVLAAGYAVGGKDPAASFLTNVRESPAVVRGEEQGFYRLDPASVQRIEQELGEAEAELADIEGQIARAYERRGEAGGLRSERERVKQRLRRLAGDREELAYVFAKQDAEGGDFVLGATRAA